MLPVVTSMRGDKVAMLDKNEFGALVRVYRNQRGWTQEELADRWGHSRAYVSLIEVGKKKLDSVAQVVRLADILDIPQEKLEAIGRGIPTRQSSASVKEEGDSNLFQMLLAPGRDMVRFSYMVWLADQHPVIEETLRNLVFNLDQALTAYRGEFKAPAQQLLAYAHQMQGKIAFDRLDLSAASGHFSDMVDLGHELNDADIITIGMVYQGSILRKRKRFETSLKCYEAAKPFAAVASPSTQGVFYINLSTVHADAGDEAEFLRAIDASLDIAADMKESIDSLANEFTLDDILWAKAGGLSELWQPESALEVYKETDKLRPVRYLREQGAYTIDKGEAFLRMGDLDKGIDLSLKGLKLALEYRSKRHIGWLERTYNLVRLQPFGQDKRLDMIQDALMESKKQQMEW